MKGGGGRLIHSFTHPQDGGGDGTSWGQQNPKQPSKNNEMMDW